MPRFWNQNRTLRIQLEETQSERKAAERRAKAAIERSQRGSGNGLQGSGSRDSAGVILRDEEALFHDLEAARDELSASKAAQVELEAQVRPVSPMRGLSTPPTKYKEKKNRKII